MTRHDSAAVIKELKIIPGYEDLLDTLTPEEIKTERCIDCDAIMKVHPDATWRFSWRVIRCDECIKKCYRVGRDEYDAKYVV